MITTDEFIKSIDLKKVESRLNKFKNEIFELRKSGLTYKQIKEFLKINGVDISISGLNKFYLKHSDNKVIDKPKKTNSTIVKSRVKSDIQKNTTLSLSEKSKSTEPKKIGSDYEIPSYAPKSLKNIDDLI